MSEAREAYGKIIGKFMWYHKDDVINYIDELERKLNPDCTKCRYESGKHAMSGVGSDWPCDSCMTNKFEEN